MSKKLFWPAMRFDLRTPALGGTNAEKMIFDI